MCLGIVVAGLLGYGLMAVGLGIGNSAEASVLPLRRRDDIEARRDVLARGQLSNRLAIAGAVTASVAMAVKIPLIMINQHHHGRGIGHATGAKLAGLTLQRTAHNKKCKE